MKKILEQLLQEITFNSKSSPIYLPNLSADLIHFRRPEPSPSKSTKPKKEKKKGKNKTAKRRNLAVREDVMNKNIYRAFKRELKSIYTAHIGESVMTEDKEIYKNKFMQIVDTFTETLINEVGIDTSIYPSFDMSACKTYIGIFLDYCYMKKTLKTQVDKDILNSSFNVIYSYSHQKFYQFLSSEEIKVILRTIILKTGIEKFLQNHESLGKDKYHTHLLSIIDRLERT